MDIPEKNTELLGALQEQISVLRTKPSPEGFHKLGRGMQSYRYALAEFLDGLSDQKRQRAERDLWQDCDQLAETAYDLACNALDEKIIDENLSYSIGCQGNLLLLVAGQTSVLI